VKSWAPSACGTSCEVGRKGFPYFESIHAEFGPADSHLWIRHPRRESASGRMKETQSALQAKAEIHRRSHLSESQSMAGRAGFRNDWMAAGESGWPGRTPRGVRPF
jgi:hypothetical protein